MKKRIGWLDEYSREATFQHAWERETFIEDFLVRIELEMGSKNISRVQLAEAMGCRPSNITRVMKNTANLTAGTMVDMARAVGLQARVLLSLRSRPASKVVRFPSPPGLWGADEQAEWTAIESSRCIPLGERDVRVS